MPTHALIAHLSTLLDPSPDMSAPRAVMLKRLEKVAAKEWLSVLRETAGK